jgi:long-subunit fatty acid transport protein
VGWYYFHKFMETNNQAMKKLFFFFALAGLYMPVFAGGILTNTNQSTLFARMLSRGASTQLDAVYYNPAGLMKLDNGLYFAAYNQSLFQTRNFSTGAMINNQEFEGKVMSPLFPDAYAVYKMDALAFSLGVGPVGGGGSAVYDNGLPSLEKQVAGMVTQLSGLSEVGYDVTGYDVNINFNGSSVMWGLQFGISARITDFLSGYLGLRYIPSNKTYEGSVSNMQFEVNGQMQNANAFLLSAASSVNSTAQLSNQAANNLMSLVSGGAGAYTLAQLQNAGYITTAERAMLEAGLHSAGYTASEIAGLNLSQVYSIYSSTAQNLFDLAGSLEAQAPLTEDFDVETKSNGSGFQPFIVGLNISPSDKLNIGIKYEHKTSITLTNETNGRDLGMDMLKDGKEVSYDMPGHLSVGVNYWITDKFAASATFVNYFDKGIDWGNNVYGQERLIDKNSWDLALGLQYNISDKFAISAGGMRSNTGVSEQFQSDIEFSCSAMTGALGFRWSINDNIHIDAGAFGSFYSDAVKSFTGYEETYSKQTFGFSVGAGFKIF